MPQHPDRARRRGHAWESAALAAAYVATGVLFRGPTLEPIAGGLAWPPAGLALGALLLFGLRLWPGVAVGAVLESWVAGFAPEHVLASSLGITTETLGSAWLLRRAGFRPSLERVRDVLLLLVIAVIGGALLGTSVNAALALLAGRLAAPHFTSYFLSCYRGDALAFLLVTPLVLTWAGAGRFDWVRRRPAESAAYFLGLVAVSHLAVGAATLELLAAFPTRYLTFPFMFWGALRHGPPAVAAANVVVVAIGARGRWLLEGPTPGDPIADRMLLLWAYSFFGSFTGLLLAAHAKEREASRRQAEVIGETNTALTRSLDLETVLQTLLRALARLVPVDGAGVMLLERDQLVPHGARAGPDPARAPEPVPVSRLSWWEELQRGSLVVHDGAADRAFGELPVGERARSLVVIPLRAGGERIGLYCLFKDEPGFFTADHVRNAEALAAQGAVAIANARLYERSRRAEEALRASEERFFKAFRSSPVSMSISTVEEWRYVEVNEAYLRLTGYEREEVLGRTSAELGVWANEADQAELVEELRRHGRVQNWEWRLRTRWGEARTGLLFAETVAIGGKPHLLAGVLDVTDTRRLEEQVRQSQKMEAVGRLAGGVAHDFNNMMMAITAQCETLLAGHAPDDPVRPAIDEIAGVATSAASLSRQLLTFSRKQPLMPRVLRLDVLCERSLRMLSRLIGENIEVRFLPDPDLRNVKVDPSGMEQVLMNLCVNARDVMRDGGSLTIAVSNVDLEAPRAAGGDVLAPGPYVTLRVADTGAGMDGATIERVFEPFFTTKGAGEGTGLGLSVVYGIVKQTGGAISVESEPGRGSTFTVYLPATDEIVEEEADAVTPGPAGGTETILVVEDHEAIRRMTAEYLADAGYRVLTAGGGEEALDLVAGDGADVDVLLTDVIMPGLTGRQLATALLERFPRLCVLYVSGYPRDALAGNDALPARSRFLQKPIPLADLEREVRALLDGR